jgi:plastocyanin
MKRNSAAVALLAVACGGGESGGTTQEEAAVATPQAAPVVTTQPTEGTGTVHQVQMLLNAAGQYRYVPAALTIKVGDTVRWLNVSGFPHNVAFYESKIPAGAKDQLVRLMPAEGKLGPLNGRLMTQPNDAFEMTFVDVPTGEYGYFCVPHEALGMVASLTIEQ